MRTSVPINQKAPTILLLIVTVAIVSQVGSLAAVGESRPEKVPGYPKRPQPAIPAHLLEYVIAGAVETSNLTER